MTLLRPALILAAPLLLMAACQDEPEVAAVSDDGRSASGEVLEGSISDAMLPLDEVRSQPPLAAPEPGEEGGSSPSSAAPAGSAPNEGADAAEPAAEPAPGEPAE